MKVEISEFLADLPSIPIIDVRAPSEYNSGHIPGAVNIPLLEDFERVEVGTIYKQKGREQALLRALEITGPKMANYVIQAKSILPFSKDIQIGVYCWRGGMRSSSMSWLFDLAGMQTKTLTKGYKAYRKHILSGFSAAKELLVLGGYTGSGKSEILRVLSQNNQVSDIEKWAHHKGSAFGFIGEIDQPTSEQFENDLGFEWLGFDLNKTIWLEDESRTIGKVYMPENLFSKIRNSNLIFIDIPKEHRISNLIKIYADTDQTQLKIALDKIIKRLGGLNYKSAILALEKGDYHTVADICLAYYDKAYQYGMEKRNAEKVFHLDLKTIDPVQNAEIIFDFYYNKVNKK